MSMFQLFLALVALSLLLQGGSAKSITPKWRFNPEAPLNASIATDSVFVAIIGSSLVGIDLQTGRQRWMTAVFQADVARLSAMPHSDKFIYFYPDGYNNTVSCFDARSGNVEKVVKLDGTPYGYYVSWFQSFALIAANTSNGTQFAALIDVPPGTIVHTATFEENYYAYGTFSSYVLSPSGYVITMNTQGLEAYSIAQRQVVWRTYAPVNLSVSSSAIYAVSENSVIACVNTTAQVFSVHTGELRWQILNSSSCEWWFGFNILTGVVFFEGPNDNFHAVNESTGDPLWSFPDPAGLFIHSQVLVVDGALLLAGEDIVRLDWATGAQLWSIPDPCSIRTVGTGHGSIVVGSLHTTSWAEVATGNVTLTADGALAGLLSSYPGAYQPPAGSWGFMVQDSLNCVQAYLWL